MRVGYEEVDEEERYSRAWFRAASRILDSVAVLRVFFEAPRRTMMVSYAPAMKRLGCIGAGN